MSQLLPDGPERVALITGGARGLGLGIARKLGQDGYRLVLCDIAEGAAQASADALVAEGLRAEGIKVDVSREAEVDAMVAQILARHGRVDALVNNAGILGLIDGRKPRIEETPLSLWQQTLDVNLTGTFLMVRAVAGPMRRMGWGRIVNMSSRAARMRTGIGNANYAASKAALIGFSRVVAGELGPDGITVNCVAPSRIETGMTLGFANSAEMFASNSAETAMGRIGSVEDVAAAVSFLCSEAAGFVTGTVMDVNGGSFMA